MNMIRITAVVVAIFALMLSHAHAFSSDIDKLPNGRNIPCPPNGVGCSGGFCTGSGHQTSDGKPACSGSPATPANQFGYDFHNAGKVWTYEVCTMDSDQDGKTNGDELGDPCCTWSIGSQPRRNTEISHPYATNAITTAPSCLLEGAVNAQNAPTVTSTSVSITLSWNAPTTQCHCGFSIYRQVNTGPFALIATVGYDTVNYQDTEVLSNTQYGYYITASNLAGNSSAGLIATVTTTGPSLPAQGNAPFLTGATENSLSVSWTAPNNNGDTITAFILLRNGSLAYSGPQTSFTDAGLTSNTVYEYRTSAVNSHGQGNFSGPSYFKTNANGATVAQNLTTPHVMSGTKSSLIITWNAATGMNGATLISYILQVSQSNPISNTKESFVTVYNGTDTVFTVSNLTMGITYSFRYAVLNSVGLSAYSPILQSTTIYCPNDCSSHGSCNLATLTCNCSAGFTGTDCSGANLSAEIVTSDYNNSAVFTGDFTVYWKVDGDEIEIAMQATASGYLAIGITDAGEDEGTADMYVGWVSNGTVYMFDYYNHDRSNIYLDSSVGGEDSIISFNGQEVNGVTSLKFRRKLITNDTTDNSIVNGSISIMYALSDSDPTDKVDVPQHKSGTSYRGWTSIDFFTGQATTTDNRNEIIMAHGVLMTAATLFLLLAMMKKYFQQWMGKIGFYIHYMLTSAGIVCAICGALTGIWITNSPSSGVHSWLGFIVVITFFAFPPIGVYADQRTEKIKFFPHYFHRILERLGVYTAVAVGAVGLKNADASTLLFIIYVSVFGGLVILHEIGFIVMIIRKKDFVEKRSKRQSKPINCNVTAEMFKNSGLEEGKKFSDIVVSNKNVLPTVNSFYNKKDSKDEIEMGDMERSTSYANIGITRTPSNASDSSASTVYTQSSVYLPTSPPVRTNNPNPPRERPRGITSPTKLQSPPNSPPEMDYDSRARHRSPTAPLPRPSFYNPGITSPEQPSARRPLPVAPLAERRLPPVVPSLSSPALERPAFRAKPIFQSPSLGHVQQSNQSSPNLTPDGRRRPAPYAPIVRNRTQDSDVNSANTPPDSPPNNRR